MPLCLLNYFSLLLFPLRNLATVMTELQGDDEARMIGASRWWSKPSEISPNRLSALFCLSSTLRWVNRMSNDAQSIRISHKAQQKDDSGCCPPHLTRLVRRRLRRRVPKGNTASFKSLHKQINHRISVTTLSRHRQEEDKNMKRNSPPTLDTTIFFCV